MNHCESLDVVLREPAAEHALHRMLGQSGGNVLVCVELELDTWGHNYAASA